MCFNGSITLHKILMSTEQLLADNYLVNYLQSSGSFTYIAILVF